MGTVVCFDGAVVARKAIRGASALLIAACFAVLVSLLFSQEAYAFELDGESAAAEDNNGFTWTIDDAGVLKITAPDEETYKGYFSGQDIDDTLSVPSEMGGETVTRVASNNSNANAAIKKLVYPRTVVDMNTTQAASLPWKLGSVEELSFSGEGDFVLESMGPTSRGSQKPMFPTTMKKFNAGEVDGVYYDCVIPSSVTTLQRQVCQNMAIASLYIPASLQTTYTSGSAAFKGCSALTLVTNVSDIWVAFPDCPNITTLNILGNPTSIAGTACEGWENLTDIEIPSTITTIGASAFKDCTSLESVKMDGVELITVENDAFSGTTALKTLTLPDTITSIGYCAFSGSSIEKLKIPASLWQGKSFSMSTGTSQDFITGPEVFSYMVGSAKSAQLFGGTSDATSPLTSITSGVRQLVDESAWNTSLKEVDLSSYSQTYIPHYMFAGSSALTSIEIPAKVAQVGFGAFTDCVALESAYFYNPNGAVLAEEESGEGSTGGGGSGWASVYPDSFSKHATTGSASDKTAAFDEYSDLDSLTIYGVGITTNPLIAYAGAHENYEFVPFAFLGGGGSSPDALAKFGTTLPDNTVSIADIESGETPVITIGYPYDEGMSRTLVSGEDCTATYTLDGREVADFYTPGTYTATIVGDDKSVWGTTTATFKVSAPAASSVPVVGDTGVTANGTLYGSSIPADAEVSVAIDVVTSGEAHDALMAAKGAGEIVGIFESALIVNGEEVHDNFGYLTLTFPVDAKYNGHWAIIYHRHANGAITSEKVVVSNGKVSTTVTDLSTFAVEIGDKVPTGSEGLGITDGATTPASSAGLGATLAQTGDTLPVMPLAALAAASLFAVGALALSRRGKPNGR